MMRADGVKGCKGAAFNQLVDIDLPAEEEDEGRSLRAGLPLQR